jgi:hypothetical protein
LNLTGRGQAGVLQGQRNGTQEGDVVDLDFELTDWLVGQASEISRNIGRDSEIEGGLLWGDRVDEDLQRDRLEEFEDVEILDHGDLRRDCRSEVSVVFSVGVTVFCPVVFEVSFLVVRRHPLDTAILPGVPEIPSLFVQTVLDLVRTDLGVLVWEHIEWVFRVWIREEVLQGTVVLVLDSTELVSEVLCLVQEGLGIV